MMLSPDFAAEGHKNVTERNSCFLELKELEKIVFDENRTNPEWDVHPGPDVRYQWTLEYIAELCKLMQEKYCREIVHMGEEME